jgi:transcriptional regulator with XRE-family HTH domain
MKPQNKKARAPRRSKKTDGIDSVDRQVGQRFRQARLMKGMSQDELGEAVGVSFQAIQKYETGDNRISASRLFRAAQFLGIPVEAFFEDVQSESADNRSEALNSNELALIRAVRAIADEGVHDTIVQLIKDFRSET